MLSHVFFTMYVTSDLGSQWSNCQLRIWKKNLHKNYSKVISAAQLEVPQVSRCLVSQRGTLLRCCLLTVLPPVALRLSAWWPDRLLQHLHISLQLLFLVKGDHRRSPTRAQQDPPAEPEAFTANQSTSQSASERANERLLLLVVIRDYFKWGNWN